tara:strand:- start:74 stop:238 length:165 start_codon:yes stop_codon:yes gene_type:complete
MNIGCEIAYSWGRRAYQDGKCFEDCPEDLSETEKDLWQLGFDEAALGDLPTVED